MKDIYLKQKFIPSTKTTFSKKGSRWVEISKEQKTISPEQTEWILSKEGLPCEKSHRLYKADKYGHNHPYDTFESVSPDGMRKVRWTVDFYEGDKALRTMKNEANR